MATPSRLPSVRRKPTSQLHQPSTPSDPMREDAGTQSHMTTQVRSTSPSKIGLLRPTVAQETAPSKRVQAAAIGQQAAVRDIASGSRMPPPSLPSRTQSIRRTATGGLPQRPDALSQTGRSGSQDTTNTSALKRSTSTRVIPPTVSTSSGLHRTPSIKPPLHSRTQSSIQAPSTSSLRQPTTHKRTQSATKIERSTDSPSTPPAQPSLSASTRIRPAFSTNQQHFSPAKTSLPKPPIPSLRTGPTPTALPEIDTLSTTLLQSSLLHLSLLHQASLPISKSYTASAKRSLRTRFTAIETASQQLREQESLLQRQINISALAKWSEPSPHALPGTSQNLTENAQRLSKALSDLSSLTAKGGRYDSLVSEFETWITSAEEVSASRARGDGKEAFIDALSPGWESLHASLEQRVRILEREVKVLPPAPEREEGAGVSTLEVVLGEIHGVVGGMREELTLMRTVADVIIHRERDWIDRTVERILSADEPETKLSEMSWKRALKT